MIRFGIIGTGRIASQFAAEAREIDGIELTGVCARDFEKTKAFAGQYGIERAHPSSDDLLADEQIDAVYIATFHPTHRPYSLKALEAGKHVLCEKPAVLSAADLSLIFETARRKKRLFMEAMTVGFNPAYRLMKEVLAEGIIGDIVHVESTFGRKSVKKHKHTPALAGGALYDIAVYNVFLLIDLLGEPKTVYALKRDNPWGVDGGINGLFDYERATGSFYATMDSFSGEYARIIGTEGLIELPDQWTTTKAFTFRSESAPCREYRTDQSGWLRFEIEDFVQTIVSGRIENETMSWEKTLSLHRTIDRLREVTGIEYDHTDTGVI